MLLKAKCIVFLKLYTNCMTNKSPEKKNDLKSFKLSYLGSFIIIPTERTNADRIPLITSTKG